MPTPTSSTILPVVDSGPESLFRITDIGSAEEADGVVVRASMPTGPWLDGPDGRPTSGAIGVLVDNVLGYAIIASRPPDHWSVSTEIALDLVAALPTDGGALHADARVVHADGIGGLAVGRVTDDEGRVVALTRQRGRFVPAAPGTGMRSLRFDVDPATPDLETLLAARRTPDGLALEVAAILQNPMRNLHGGITLAAADLAATIALDDGGPALVTGSVNAVYARAVPADAQLDVTTTVQHRGRTLAIVDVVGRVAGRVCTITRVVAQPG